MIPKIIHQTWKNTEIPENWKFGVEECKKIHDDYEYKLWTDDMMEDFVKKEYSDFYETYKSYKYHIQRCDAFRYLVLYKYGGIYIDMDIVCKKKLDNLLKYDIVFTKSPNVTHLFTNAFYMSTKNNKFIKYCIDNLPKNAKNRLLFGKHSHVVYSTGPNFLSNMIKDYKLENIKNNYVLTREEYAGNCDVCNISNTNICEGGYYFTHVVGQSWNSLDSKLFNDITCIYKNKIMFVFLLLIIIIIIYFILKKFKIF
jgi:mannosyltransferase OCH1-like enzyme